MGAYGVETIFGIEKCLIPKVDLEKRLDYFVGKDCKIADYDFDFISENDENLLWIIENGYNQMILQLHFGTFRNVNSAMLTIEYLFPKLMPLRTAMLPTESRDKIRRLFEIAPLRIKLYGSKTERKKRENREMKTRNRR